MKYLMITLACLGLTGCVTSGGMMDSDTISGWSFRNDSVSASTGYGFRVVSKEDGHPVRSGDKSLRFEVRHGDCKGTPWWDDCSTDRERVERVESYRHNVGEYWYAWSLYLPEDFPSIYPVLVILGQFKGWELALPAFTFDIAGTFGGGYYRPIHYRTRGVKSTDPLPVSAMRGRWTDVLIHANWTKGDHGWLRMYVNGKTEPTYHYSGFTSPREPHGGIYFKFGIYRAFVSRRFVSNPKAGDTPTQIVYYDDVRKGKSCQDVTKYFDCAVIMSGTHGS